MEGVPELDVNRAARVYQDSLDIQVSMLDNDDQGAIIARIESDGVLFGKGDVNSCFPSCALGETMRYYICYKHLPCTFPFGGAKATSTSETSDYDICVGMYNLVVHL